MDDLMLEIVFSKVPPGFHYWAQGCHRAAVRGRGVAQADKRCSDDDVEDIFAVWNFDCRPAVESSRLAWLLLFLLLLPAHHRAGLLLFARVTYVVAHERAD